MSIKKEEVKNTKITAKGVLVEITELDFHIQDEKTGDIEVLSLDDIEELLVGKPVNITLVNKEEVD